MTLSAARQTLRLSLTLAFIASASLVASSTVSAQSAGSWVDIAQGAVGSGASASGALQFAKSKSSSKNGVDFGHGFAVGAGPNGIALSNSIGAGGGPLGVAHNVQLNIGAGGAHVSHGGVVSEGGNRRVFAGGETGTSNGRVHGGSSVGGFGNRTRAYSKSRTRQWSNTNQPVYNNQPAYNAQPVYSSQPSPNQTFSGSVSNRGNTRSWTPSQASNGSGFRSSGRGQVFTMGRAR